MKRNNVFVPLGNEDAHGSERHKSGNAPAKGEKHDSSRLVAMVNRASRNAEQTKTVQAVLAQILIRD